jgi:membrane-bound lytic murein transglycosylase D
MKKKYMSLYANIKRVRFWTLGSAALCFLLMNSAQAFPGVAATTPILNLPPPTDSAFAAAPEEAKDVWSAIQNQLILGPEANNVRVRQQMLWYLNHRKILNTILNNATPFIYYVYQQTQQRGMPAMFALLPLLESGYDSNSYSRTGAAGIWQMMPGTATSYKLDIDWWNDGRKDILTSTTAALNYLVELKQALGNWYLAAAGYDAGQSAIENAMRANAERHLNTDFWSLALPDETKAYVPRLIALAVIIKNADRLGVKLPDVPNQPFFIAVKMNSQLSLEEIASLANIPISWVQLLNPNIRRFSTEPNVSYTLLIPAVRSELFFKNLSRMQGKKHWNWQYHEVHAGETLADIAKNYHTKADIIQRANGMATQDVQAGQDILVPIWLNKTYQNALGVVWPANSSQQTALPLPAASASVASAPNSVLLPDSLGSAMTNTPPGSDLETMAIQKAITGTNPFAPSSQMNQTSAAPDIERNSSTVPITDSDNLKTLMNKIYGKNNNN